MNSNTDKLCYMTDAQETLGLSYEQFKALGLEPFETVQNPHSEKGKAYLFQKDTIEQLINDPRVVAMRARRPKKEHKELSLEQKLAKLDKRLEARQERRSRMNVKILWSDKMQKWSWNEKAWIGLIKKWESGSQAFKFGIADYRKGIFEIEAKAGDIVKYGHSNPSTGNKESRYALVLVDSGATKTISPKDALRIWNDSHGKQSEANIPLEASLTAKTSPIQSCPVESSDWGDVG
jgi:hypothetical protein